MAALLTMVVLDANYPIFEGDDIAELANHVAEGTNVCREQPNIKEGVKKDLSIVPSEDFSNNVFHNAMGIGLKGQGANPCPGLDLEDVNTGGLNV